MLSLSFNPFPELQSQRLLLRRILKSDAKEVLYLRGTQKVMQYIDKPLQKTIADALAHIELMESGIINNNSVFWGISLRQNTGLVGIISYHAIDKINHRAEIGYILHDQYWGQGITNEAVALVLDFGFNKLKFHSIEAKINPENLASKNLLLKHKFIKEAYFRENFYYEGTFLDTEIYSLLN